MDFFNWIFTKKNKEVELDFINKYQKKISKTIKKFNAFSISLNEKKSILDSINFKDFPHFFYGSKIQKKITETNKKIIKNIEDIVKIENLDEHLLRHLLIESSTRLNQISQKLGVKALHRGIKSNNIEESKRRSIIILKNEESFQELIKSLENEFLRVHSKFKEYFKIILNQDLLIEKKYFAPIKRSLMNELNWIQELNVLLKRFILLTLAKSRKFIEEREVEINKESLLFKSNAEGLIIFHAIANSPEENRKFSGFFARKGYSVFAPRLPGHGTNEDEFYNTSIREILDFSQKALDFFFEKNENKPIFVSGLSLGGMITLYLASKKKNYGKIKGIIPINAFIKSADSGAKLIEKIPKGQKILEALIQLLKLKSVKKKSIALNERIKITGKKINSSFLKIWKKEKVDDILIKEILKEYITRVKTETQGIISEQIYQRPDDTERIISDYNKIIQETEKDFIKKYKEKGMSLFDIQDLTQLFDFNFYKILTWKGMMELTNLANELQKRMNQIICPTLIIQAEKDNTVDQISADIIYNKISSMKKEVYKVPNAGHMVILERNREVVFKKIEEFMKSIEN